MLALPLAAITALWGWSTYRIALRFADLAYDRALYDAARTLATQIKLQDGTAVLDLSEDEREMLEVDPLDKVYFAVTSGGGRHLGGSLDLPAPDPGSVPSEFGSFYDRVAAGESLRIVEVRIDDLGPEPLFVRVAETRRKRTQLATEALVATMPLLAGFIAVIVLTVWWSVERGFRPLAAMRETISGRHHGDLSPLSSRGLPPELRSQVEVINELMARLGQVLETERRFLAYAAHQLRTPITVLRTQTELALRSATSPALRDHLQEMDRACQRLTRLANQLLNLSRAEAGLEGLGDVGPLDLTALLGEVVARHEPLAHDKGQKLEIQGDRGPLWVNGSALMLGEMLANLLDNAIRYTPPGGQIAVEAVGEGPSVRLTVRDDGPGIGAPEPQQVLSPFYRGVTATQSGSGLGLAIAQEICRAHGGRLVLRSTKADGTGLSATIELPRSDPEPARVETA